MDMTTGKEKGIHSLEGCPVTSEPQALTFALQDLHQQPPHQPLLPAPGSQFFSFELRAHCRLPWLSIL
jgi:hypothetical protein